MAPFVTANGVNVIKAHLVRPRVGVWHAELTVDAETADAFTGAVSIVLADLMTFQGFARRVGAHHNTVFLRAVGGAGGLGKTVPPRSWQNVPLRIPLMDALAAVGETLSPSADSATLNTLLPKWSRPQRTAGVELGALVVAVPGAVWRVLPDGTIWVGQETWPTSSIEFEEIEFEPSIGRLEVGSDLPQISPGQVFAGEGEPYANSRVSTVEHIADANRLRNFLIFEDPTFAAGDPDRITRGLTTFIRSIVDKRLDTLALYPANVVAQNADGTLELQPDDPRWPGFSNVPIRYGVPGITAKVASGARVLLGFAGGDPRKPIAELWESASVTELDVNATTVNVNGSTLVVLNGGTLPIARLTDQAGPFKIVGPGNLKVLG